MKRKQTFCLKNIKSSKIFFFFLTLFSFYLHAQYEIKFIDEKSKKPIQGVELYCENTKLGVSNADGILQYKTNCTSVYSSKKNYIDELIILKENQVISLVESGSINSIKMVVIENKSDPKALAILDKVYRKFDENTPKSLPSYSYKAYNKISFDVNEDSLSHFQESIRKVLIKDSIQATTTNKKDSTLQDLKVLQASKMLLWERAMEYIYSRKFGEKINILDNRVSGFKEPIYEMMAFRSNRDKIPREIDIAYRKNYRFFLSDSIELDGREYFIIKFRELKNKLPANRKQFSGLIWIDKETFGLKKIERNSKIPSDGNINSNYIYFGGKWFLESENLKMKIGSMELNYKENREKNNPKEKYNNYCYFYTKYFDHKTPIKESSKEFKGYTYSVQNSDGSLLENFRTIPLNEREQNTYQKIDCLGQKYGVDSKAKQFSALLHGKIRMGIFDSDLSKTIGYNAYEGFKTAIHLKTNEKLNRWISADAFTYYGFRDKAIKYELGLESKISQKKNSFFRFAIYDHVGVAGSFSESFWDFRMKLNNSGIVLNNDRFYRFRGLKLSFENDFGNSISTRLELKKQKENTLFDYQYKNVGDLLDHSSLIFSLYYAPFSKHIMTPSGKLTTEKKFPEMFINIEKGLTELGGDFSFTKLDFLTNFYIKSRLGNTGIRFYAGWLEGDAPIWHQFSANGLSANGTVNFNITSYLGFATMRAGEYFNSAFVGNYFTHRIPWYFKITQNNISSLDLIHRSIIGKMNSPNIHLFDYKAIDHLYQEVGVEWNNFFSKWFNLGLFYRIGYYQTPEFMKNIGIQFKLKLLGF